MNVGDTVTITNREWVVRAFSAAEHARFDEIAAQHDLHALAIEAETLRANASPGARQAFIEADMRRVRNDLAAYLEDGAVKAGLTPEERARGYELSLELELLENRLHDLQRERATRLITLDERLTEARENAVTAFMHEILSPPEDLQTFRASLSPADLVTLEEAASVGKLRTGLSASARRREAYWEKAMTQIATEPDSGNASESSRPPQE